VSARELITEHLDLWTGAVTKKSSSGRGANGKVELTGIKKLRELILELAVRGQLIEQESCDTPASILVDEIHSHREKLVDEGNLKKQTKLYDIANADAPYRLPEGWEWCRMGELAEVIRGVTYKKHQVSEQPRDEHVALLRANNIQETITDESVVYVPLELINKRQLITEGDILIAMSSGSANLVGKAAQASSEIHATFGAFCAVIRPLGKKLSLYLGFFTTTPTYRQQAQASGKGIGINNLNKKALDNLLVPVPPIEEQHRIVQKVDELMALCDRLEQQTSDQLEAHETLVDTLLGTLTQSENATELADNWARLATHFDTLFTTEQSIEKLKQTILQLAVMGRLVEQDAGDEPATKLVERVKADKALLIKNKEIKAQAKLKSTHQEETSRKMPGHWVSATLDDLSHVQGGIQKQPKRRPQEHRYPYLRVADVQRGFLMACSDLPEFELFNDELRQYRLKEGDILVVEGNGSAEEIGRCAIWDGRVPNCVYQNHLMRVRPIVTNTSDYIALYLNSPLGINEMKRLAVTSSGLYNLSVGKIRSIPVPLPPLHEQIRIVQKVDELMALCDKLKERLNQANATRSQLAESVVEGALSA
jgi:type I restriction enzyme S subunit